MKRSAAGLAIAIVGAMHVGACEVLVPGALPAATCEGSAPDTCPPGQYCRGTQCLPCGEDSCSGADGGQAPDGLVAIDATEAQAGDSETDASETTDVTQLADASSDTLSAADSPSSPGDAGCAAGGLGCACSAGTACASLLCATSAVLPSLVTTQGSGICTQTCCTSADCPSDFVCYGAGTGGNYCVLAARLSRPSGVASAAPPGTSCTLPTDCRSGVCAGGHCEDTCCADADCAAPTACSLAGAVEGHTTFACVVPAGTLADKATCSTGPQCESSVCSFATCRPHCCGAAQAADLGFPTCTVATVGNDVYAYAEKASTGFVFGASCTTDTQCASRNCDTAAGSCSDVCCTDKDCQGYRTGLVCRPAQAGPSPLTTLRLICTPGP